MRTSIENHQQNILDALHADFKLIQYLFTFSWQFLIELGKSPIISWTMAWKDSWKWEFREISTKEHRWEWKRFDPGRHQEHLSWVEYVLEETRVCLIIFFILELGELNKNEIVDEIKRLYEEGYQLGIEEGKEITRGKYLNIFAAHGLLGRKK